MLYPGPRPIQDEEMPLAHDLLGLISGVNRDEFTVQLGEDYWRGRHDKKVIDGEWYRMRNITGDAPTLRTLITPLPRDIERALLSPKISRGGIIHICGQAGSGKTTTASAIAVSRLTTLGGFCYGMEDPPEYPLNGWHGPSGYFAQTWVDDWEEAMKGALRSQPAATDLMMYIGEIRDAATAKMMIRAASNGFLVISTGFGSDLVSAVDTFAQILGPESIASFAGDLRVLLYQKLEKGLMSSDVLISRSPTSEVAVIMRSGQFGGLRNEIDVQRTARRLGNLPEFE